jgi:hypothetical protein
MRLPGMEERGHVQLRLRQSRGLQQYLRLKERAKCAASTKPTENAISVTVRSQ